MIASFAQRYKAQHNQTGSYGSNDALRDTERFGPEAAGSVHRIHNLFDS
jgi:hypothetical protein